MNENTDDAITAANIIIMKISAEKKIAKYQNRTNFAMKCVH